MEQQEQTTTGVPFTVYLSPSNDTAQWITHWSVSVQNSDWTGTVTSADPVPVLHGPAGMGGTFNVTVLASGPNLSQQELTSQSGNQVSCNSDCQVLVGILAEPMGYGGSFWFEVICPITI